MYAPGAIDAVTLLFASEVDRVSTNVLLDQLDVAIIVLTGDLELPVFVRALDEILPARHCWLVELSEGHRILSSKLLVISLPVSRHHFE